MSNPERLYLVSSSGTPEELVVTPDSPDMDKPRSVAVPHARDVAVAIARASDAWFGGFLRELQKRSPNRANVVASIIIGISAADDVVVSDADVADLRQVFPEIAHHDDEDLRNMLSKLGSARGLKPVDAADSAHLLQLRQAIDSVGWNTPEEQERGDYVGRVHQLREEIAAADLVHARNLKLEKLNRAQRRELRRFNRETRARKEGATAGALAPLTLQELAAVAAATGPK